jgi:glyoxylase-like metal-dependent hydrolase (beta-lactamase superfamily II)
MIDESNRLSLSEHRSKRPRLILPGLYAFPPHRAILGGTAYLLLHSSGNVLIDCPGWDRENQQFLAEQGGVRWLTLTHRGGISPSLSTLQQALDCQVLIQEQEAYLLPNLAATTFQFTLELAPELQLIWTPGHSPGSACLYTSILGGILFTGRHLLPDCQGHPLPIRLPKTFHWQRQLNSVAQLRDRFSAKTLNYLCPGANTGFLRGKGVIDQAYQQLCTLDLRKLSQPQP